MSIWHSSTELPDKDRYVLVELSPEFALTGPNERYAVIKTIASAQFDSSVVEKWCYIVEIS